MSYRILVTGSREWDQWDVVEGALRNEYERARAYGLVDSYGRVDAVLVHGGAKGLDQIAHEIWEAATDCDVEPHMADWFSDPKERNQWMVDQGADICLAFALKWASGTGHCARAARRAGIPTIDLGVNTA